MTRAKFQISCFSPVLVVLAFAACNGQALDPSQKGPPTRPPAAVEPVADSTAGSDPLLHWLFPSAAQALEAVLDQTDPKVVGFGEIHQQTESLGTLSSLERFNNNLLPILAARTSDLIVETWISQGSCGREERKVVTHVEEISDRPSATEEENITLLKRAKHLGLEPHILEMRCEDYGRVLDPKGKVNYLALLALVGRRLGDKAAAVLSERAGGGKMVAIYSGDIHNDIAPEDDFKTFTYAEAVQKASGGRYVEVDLYVPEFVEQSDLLRHEPWYPLFTRLASSDHAALIQKGAASYIIIYRRGIRNPQQTPK